MAKENFLLKDEWRIMFSALPDETAGRLIKAIFNYHAGEDVSIDDPVLSAVFTMLIGQIDENDRRYEEICEKRRESGRRGGRPKKANETKCNQMQPNATKVKQTKHDSDNDSDYISTTVDIYSENTPTKKPVKHKYGEYQKVRLTDADMQKLINEFGEADTNDAIVILDEYKARSGKRYDNDYLAMRKWVFDEVRKQHERNEDRNYGFTDGNGVGGSDLQGIPSASEFYGFADGGAGGAEA